MYPQTFLPWTEPVNLRRGDRVSVELWAGPDGDPWGWNTEVRDPAGALKTRFKQSSFVGQPRGIAVPGKAP